MESKWPLPSLPRCRSGFGRHCLENFRWLCHTLEMAKKKTKKKAGKTKPVPVREWAPGQPFDSLEKSPTNTAKKAHT
jgi:hypothetical protein